MRPLSFIMLGALRKMILQGSLSNSSLENMNNGTFYYLLRRGYLKSDGKSVTVTQLGMDVAGMYMEVKWPKRMRRDDITERLRGMLGMKRRNDGTGN